VRQYHRLKFGHAFASEPVNNRLEARHGESNDRIRN
jgi:hypothetical protein